MSVALEPLLTPGGQVSRPFGNAPATVWRSLFYFNVYRLIGAVLLLVMATAWRDTLPFGSRDYNLFVLVTVIYCAIALI